MADKDFGVTMCCTLDSSLQCAKLVGTANKVLDVIKRTYVYMSQSNIMYLLQVACKTTFRILLFGLTSAPVKGH